MNAPCQLPSNVCADDISNLCALHVQSDPSFSGGAETGFSRFTVVLMTASPAAAAKVQKLLQPALEQLQLQGAINVAPVPGHFTTPGNGLQPHSPYFMLMMRNIVSD